MVVAFNKTMNVVTWSEQVTTQRIRAPDILKKILITTENETRLTPLTRLEILRLVQKCIY